MAMHACDILGYSRPDPCSLIIFGGSGDLTGRKLVPALYSLFLSGGLPAPWLLLACGRSPLSDDQFRRKMEEHCRASQLDLSRWPQFAACLRYHRIAYDEAGFVALREALLAMENEQGLGGNRVFDLAVPPSLYPVIGELLGMTGLASQQRGWTRLVVEKPFGRDLTSAQELDATLQRHFLESQIYRIDHYLAKETVQNLLIFRFANAIFEPLWNRQYIERVGIIAAEALGIGTRAGYYEEAGVVRDMFQNHMMQLLALVAMEPPDRFEAGPVQDEKAKVLRSLRPFQPGEGSELSLGQYTTGRIDGVQVAGYRGEAGVAADSLIPTFACMRLFLDNWRWQGVPFHLVSGKRMARKETRIVIQFKEVPHRLFGGLFGDSISANRLVIETYPDEAIRLSFQTKHPGPRFCLRSMTMDFLYREHYRSPALNAYAKVLQDCMLGDHMLFWRQDGVELAWSFLTPVLEQCEHCPRIKLLEYPAGSWGPACLQEIIEPLLGLSDNQ